MGVSAIMNEFTRLSLLLAAVTVCYCKGGTEAIEKAYRKLQAENDALTAEIERLKQGSDNAFVNRAIQECKCHDGWFGKTCEKQAVAMHVQSKTTWGDWYTTEFCPFGSFARLAMIKIESAGGDDTAVNGVKLKCYTKDGYLTKDITSAVQVWGTWQPEVANCGNGFINGAMMRSEPALGDGDDTAVDDIYFSCTDGSTTSPWFVESVSHWGTWDAWEKCGRNQAVCGIQTQIDDLETFSFNDTKIIAPRGYDDVALNSMKLYCCDL